MVQITDYVRHHLPEWVRPARTAVCVIDIQADFAAPDGLMAFYGADMSSLSAAVAKAGELVDGARECGVPVIFIGLQTKPETDSPIWTERMRRREGDPELESAVCREGTPGAAFYGPQPNTGEPVVYKHKYSGFYKTELNETLTELGVDTLVCCGLTTECCIDSTVRDAFHRDFNVFVVADASAAYGDEIHQSSLAVLDLNFALLTNTSDMLAAWRAPSNSAATNQG